MMWNNNRPPPPDWIKDAYRILCDHIADPQEGIERERAHEMLVQAQDFPDEPADARHAIDRLLSRGYLYEVDSMLRVTDPEIVEE